MARPREFDEATVVRAAMQVFWKQGYRATSIEDLVEATGLQRGSLYGAFGDKHGLLNEALDAYGHQMVERLDGLLAEFSDPVDGLRQFIRAAGLDCHNDETSGRGCLIGNTCTELAAHDDVARAQVERFLAKFRLTMANSLRRGQAMGTFPSDRDADAVAMFIQCSLQGLATLARTRPDPKMVDGVIHELIHILDQQPSDTAPTQSEPRTHHNQQE
jgi:TetR/AcrR family transcriptional repressor of nem operon